MNAIKHHALSMEKIAVGASTSALMHCADGGLKQHFEFCSLYHAPSNEKTFYVSAYIRDKYLELDAEEGLLGYPIDDVKKDPEIARGVIQSFQGGWIGWSPKKGIYYEIFNSLGERGIQDVMILTKYAKETHFFKLYYNYAVALQNVYKIPALFTLAQSALETGWGKKAPSNNMFGIKADKNWTGQKVLVETDEYFTTSDKPFPNIISIEFIPSLGQYRYRVQDWFRAYNSPLESFNDRAQFFMRKRYEKAFLYTDSYNFAREIAAGGYATNPNYYTLLASIISKLETIRIALQNTMMDSGANMGGPSMA
jgi:Mannosyl-glycoprotein endo-beta-N-acetylglucosaminidase/LGFP repeat